MGHSLGSGAVQHLCVLPHPSFDHDTHLAELSDSAGRLSDEELCACSPGTGNGVALSLCLPPSPLLSSSTREQRDLLLGVSSPDVCKPGCDGRSE